MLVQCSWYHALGHTKASRACTLGCDSVKCYICGNAHKLEEHDHCCPRKHAIAGKCDCTNYRCINCLQLGHHCRNEGCPACDQYHLHQLRRLERVRDKGKGRDPVEGPGLRPTSGLTTIPSNQTLVSNAIPPTLSIPSGPCTHSSSRGSQGRLALPSHSSDIEENGELTLPPSHLEPGAATITPF